MVVPDVSPADGKDVLKGHGFSRAAAASLQDERGEQSRAGLLPAQDSQDVSFGTPEGVPLQSPGLKPNEEGEAQRRAEARLYPNETSLTRTGMKLGTAGNMSPEQIRGEPLDARTDIFSFGLVLYEMATGERAFTGETEAILHDAIQHREPTSVRDLAPEISPHLQSIIEGCLHKDRESRYQNAGEVRLQLQHSSGATTEARKSPPRRKRWLAIAAIAMVCATTAADWFYWRHSGIPPLKSGATIILAYPVNATNDAVLDQALERPLVTEFQQTPFFNRLGNNKIRETLTALKQPEDSRLTPELARGVCQLTNSDAVVQSSIKDAGNKYLIELEAVRCDSGAKIAKSEVNAEKRDQIIKMLGVAGARLRAKLGEPADSINAYNKFLDKATSASPEALQAEAQGWKARAQNDTAALLYYKRAVELDPKFASAQLNIGTLYVNAGENAHAAEHLRAAFALRDRLTQRDRVGVEAFYYSVVTGETDKAIAAYERGVEMFSGDFQNHNNLSYHLRVLGQPERSAAQAREALRIQPRYAPTFNLALSEMAMERPENAKRALDEAQKLGVEAPQLTAARYLLAFCEGDRAAMQKQVAFAKGKPGFEPRLISKEAETAAFVGQFRRSRLLVAQASKSDQKDGGSERRYELLLEEAFREAEVGDVAAAQNALTKVTPLGEGVYVNSLAAITMANSGDIAGAQKLTDQIIENHPLDTVAQKFWLPAARALIDLHKEAPAEAVRNLEVSTPLELAQPGVWEPFGNMYPTYVRGLTYLKANEGESAAREFQRIIDHRELVANFIIGAIAHLQLARAQVMMGDKDAARKSYQDFLTLWKDADPDIPIYRQAKAEYAKLNKSVPAATVSSSRLH